MSKIQAVADAVAAGKAKLVGGLVQEALDDGCQAVDVLNAMIDAMGVVGERFKNNEIFVPEMLVAARAMKKGVEVLKPHLSAGDTGTAGKMILGTVAGDLHDIGKNLVASMFEGCGFEVINLGTDVSAKKFVDAVCEYHADILCMSALLTTTMNYMREVIAALNESGVREKVKVMIGGAPTTPEFARQIGADGYSDNANSAVILAKNLLAS